MSTFTKLIQVAATPRATTGRLPVIHDGDGRIPAGVTGSRGPFIAGGPVLQTLVHKAWLDAADTLTAAQVIGGFMSFASPAATRNISLPSAASIIAYIGQDLCQPNAIVTLPVAATNNAGVSYPIPTFEMKGTIASGTTNAITFVNGAGTVQFLNGIAAANAAIVITPSATVSVPFGLSFLILNATPGAESVAVLRSV